MIVRERDASLLFEAELHHAADEAEN